MRSSNRAEPRPLTGADCFLRAFDAETRRLHGASHLSQLVLRLGAGFDRAAFQARLADVVHANPILRAPVRRRFGVGPPIFDLARAGRAAMPVVEQHAGGAGRADGVPPIPEIFFRRLSGLQRAERGELLRFDLVEYDGGPVRTDLAMTWCHMLLDGSGSERFVERLARCGDADERAPAAAPSFDDEPTAASTPALPLRARGDIARGWLDHMNGYGRVPPVSLAGPPRSGRQRLDYVLTTLDREATAVVRRRASDHAGFLTPVAFYLAAVVRAHDAVFRHRGIDPGSYVIPLPVNLRAKGLDGPVFQTRVAMMWFQVMPDVVEDLSALVESIKRQRLDAIKSRRIDQSGVAIDFIRAMPTRLYARLARSTFRGEIASFLFAFTDAFLPGLEHFFGAPIVNGFHAPSVTPSPGSSAILCTRNECLNVAHVRQAGLFDAEAEVVFQRRLVADLTGGTP